MIKFKRTKIRKVNEEMKRENFVKEFLTASPEINMEHINDTIVKSIDANLTDGNPRGHHNLIIVMEELGELIQEVSKEIREKGNRMDLIQEMADEQICLWYIQEMCVINIEDVYRAINV